MNIEDIVFKIFYLVLSELELKNVVLNVGIKISAFEVKNILCLIEFENVYCED